MATPRRTDRAGRPPKASARPRAGTARPAPEGPGTIVFSHANGFPAGTYRRLFEAWRAAGHRIVAIERIGHDPAHPVTSNWPHLRDALVTFIEQHAPAERVHLVGHSLGGFLSVMVTCARPDLVRSVVLLDSPIVAGWRAHGLHVAKRTGLIRRVSPGKVSQRRRHEWPDRAAVLAHFQSKAAFARWDPRVLADYVASGFDDHGGRVVLGFDRDIETRIYNTLPHHLGSLIHRHPPACPVAFLGGTQSAEVRQVGLAATRALTRGRLAWIEGTHLFPMERPDETAAAVLAHLSG
ncbi:MAG: alpha/beta hydrolase [Ideonella sp.]|jgi:pimeloyl-ACP methyl ester carboxylesterase|nr:alpha/beta hydrolase [Ideonella sp.]